MNMVIGYILIILGTAGTAFSGVYIANDRRYTYDDADAAVSGRAAVDQRYRCHPFFYSQEQKFRAVKSNSESRKRPPQMPKGAYERASGGPAVSVKGKRNYFPKKTNDQPLRTDHSSFLYTAYFF